MLSGAAEILNRADMYSRMSLSVPELGIQLLQAGYETYDKIDDTALARIIKDASSPWILSCIRKFAVTEVVLRQTDLSLYSTSFRLNLQSPSIFFLLS